MGTIHLLRRRWLNITHDLVWVVVSILAAYWFMHNLGSIPRAEWSTLAILVAVALPLHMVSFWLFGCFRGIWRFASIPDLLRFVQAVALGALLTAAVFLSYTPFQDPPRAVLALYPILLFLGVVGARVAYRALTDYTNFPLDSQDRRALIVGAGQAGNMMVRELLSNGPFAPVGMLDDDPTKIGHDLHGVRVVGKLAELERMVRKYDVDAVLVAMPSATRATLERIVTACAAMGIECRTMPSLNEIADGRVTVNMLRPVTVEDLLGRDPVVLPGNAIPDFVRGKRVLVTGGGGSIGSELCRQILSYDPDCLTILECGEQNLYTIQQEIEALDTDVEIRTVLGDCKHRPTVERLMKNARIEVVFHAAAYKHVPLVECNGIEGVRNNVVGTRVVADCADAAGVETFVLISTDKTVNPTNIMGASKRVAEIYCQALNTRSNTQFITTRFGNVLGSAGSVVPLFERQIRAGGPVTVTHPEITRYFMTIPEAVSLILQAAAMGEGGEIFVLDMGEPVKIVDLAEKMIQLYGYQPGRDIKIEYTGLRPGEKLYEELFYDSEALGRTEHPKLLLANSNGVDWESVRSRVAQLEATLDQPDTGKLVEFLRAVVPEFRNGVEETKPELRVVQS